MTESTRSNQVVPSSLPALPLFLLGERYFVLCLYKGNSHLQARCDLQWEEDLFILSCNRCVWGKNSPIPANFYILVTSSCWSTVIPTVLLLCQCCCFPEVTESICCLQMMSIILKSLFNTETTMRCYFSFVLSASLGHTQKTRSKLLKEQSCERRAKSQPCKWIFGEDLGAFAAVVDFTEVFQILVWRVPVKVVESLPRELSDRLSLNA